MADDRRRPLRDDELARIAQATRPRVRGTHSAPMLGGVDAATYELDLDIAGERRELAVRIGRSEITDDVARERLESFIRTALRAL